MNTYENVQDNLLSLSDEGKNWIGYIKFTSEKKINNEKFTDFVKKINKSYNIKKLKCKYSDKLLFNLYFLFEFEKYLKLIHIKTLRNYAHNFNIVDCYYKKSELITKILLKWLILSKFYINFFFDENLNSFFKGTMKNLKILFLSTLSKSLIKNHKELNVKNIDDLNDKLLCIVCFCNVVSMIGIKCKHLSCCISCSQKLQGKCPICRSNSGFEKIFLN